MKLAIDFDGVLHDIANPLPGRRMGAPLPGAIDAMCELYDEGHELIIHSVRGGRPRLIEEWCEYYDIPYHSITNIKPNADLYIDDKARQFISWEQLLPQLLQEEDNE